MSTSKMTEWKRSHSDQSENDEYRKKRQRNNLAVRKCRKRLTEEAKETKNEVRNLKTENERLKGQIEALRQTVRFLRNITLEKNPPPEEDTVTYILKDNSVPSEKFEGSENTSVTITKDDYSEIKVENDALIIPSDQQQELGATPLTYLSSASPSTFNSDAQQACPTFIPPGPITSESPTLPTSEASEVLQRPSKKRKSRTAAIQELADSLKQLIEITTLQHTESISTLPVDPVDGFVKFIAPLLRSFQDEKLKFELMNNITQTIFNMKKTVCYK